MYCRQICSLTLGVLTLTTWIGARKYDVNQEAVKLFGENIHNVLRRFRRTPDYLKILTGKKGDLDRNVMRSSFLLLHHNAPELQAKVLDALGVATKASTVQEASTSKLYNLFEKLRMRRQNEDQVDKSEEENANVKLLDAYPKLTSALTVAEKNAFKDLGFQIAGGLIHKVIDTLEPDGVFKSTLGPLEATTTTHIHEVTTPSMPPPPTGEERYRMRAKERSNPIVTKKNASAVTNKL